MIKINQIKENVYQIKVIDLELRDFHGPVYEVKEGASYNCYLVIDEKISLIDVIDYYFFVEAMDKMKEILQGRVIDNIIINHVEPDHSGSFLHVKALFPNSISYTSKAGEKAMQQHFFGNEVYTVVGDGDSINTGKYNFSFVETPLVHWPDNMWTYMHETKILFSNDSFGQLLVDDVVYDSEISVYKLLKYSREYYANIVWPYNNFVKKVFDKIGPLNLDIELICPAHGIILKDYIKEMMDQYMFFCTHQTVKKAVICYDTMWGNSKMMGLSIKTILEKKGYAVHIYQISKVPKSHIMDDLIDAEIICIGSGNYNNCVLPPVADLLERLKASRIENKKVIGFGSYGWTKMALSSFVERLKAANLELICDPIYIQYVPSPDQLFEIEEKIMNALE